MTSALKLEALLYKKLKEYLSIAVYNHVPGDAELPFIRIGDISYREWLCMPVAYHAKLTLAIFSEAHSNQQVLEISAQVVEVLAKNFKREIFPQLIQLSIGDTNVFQLKNLSWCAEIELDTKYISNKEVKNVRQ